MRAEVTRLEPQEHKENDSNGSLTSREIAPMTSLKYNWTDELNSYITYSYGFKSPSYDKVYGYIPHLFLGNPMADFVIESNLGLKMEKSHNWELGTKYYSGDTSLSLAIFTLNIRILSPRVTSGNLPITGWCSLSISQGKKFTARSSQCAQN